MKTGGEQHVKVADFRGIGGIVFLTCGKKFPFLANTQ